MRAMILCAGLGTRLRPHSSLWPKPAMPFLGAPLLRYTLATLHRAGVGEVGINTHHLSEVMQRVAQAETTRLQQSLVVAHEHREIQGTGGGIRGLRDFLCNDVSVVLNGDVLFTLDVAAAVAAHRKSGADATMVLLPMPEGETYNSVDIDEGGCVQRIAGLGPGGDRLTSWHFSGAHVLGPHVFDFMAESGPEDINRDVYQRMLRAGLKVHGHVVTSRDVYWSDVGTPERYLATVRDVLFGRVSLSHFAEASPFAGMTQLSSHVWVHPTAELRDARISGPAWVGAGAVLEQGVRLGAGVVVGVGSRIGANTMLNRVAVLDGTQVGSDLLLEDAMVSPATFQTG